VEAKKLERKLCCARKFLQDRRWEGPKPTLTPASNGPAMPGVVIWPGTEQWEAWQVFFEQQAVYEANGVRITRAQFNHHNENNRLCRVPSEWPPEEDKRTE
jgi:hypothetical protein